jgi:hypothetical protein
VLNTQRVFPPNETVLLAKEEREEIVLVIL